ncbi:MAG: toll/interleukin-1 receptor domain-containing protein [Bacteroidales bacterium]|nr:toll/interleukin-1 receptor domain-containing protein [Candidatus Latescibacterota bacterium]
MSDVFISYSRSDRDKVGKIAELLTKKGYDVWWDKRLLPGDVWLREIATGLRETRLVLVLWSEKSIKSDNVLSEALYGIKKRTLLQALIEDVEIPYFAEIIQASNIVGWPDKHDKTELDMLLEAVKKTLETKPVESTGSKDDKIVDIRNASEKAKDKIKTIKKMSDTTESKIGGIEANRTVEDAGEVIEVIDTNLEVMDKLGEKGREVNDIRVENVEISRIELLVQKAKLLIQEANRMKADENAPEKKKNKVLLKKQKEAYRVLEKAGELVPENTEILLEKAKLLIDLTPDDPTDEERLLYKIQDLLKTPKNDREQFHIAEATMLLAISRGDYNKEQLGEAKRMFGKIDRQDRVEECEFFIDLAELTSLEKSDDMEEVQPLPQPAEFQPVGQWAVYVSDAMNSFISLNINPDGSFSCLQQVPAIGLNMEAQGQWGYNQVNKYLQIQGMRADWMPFMMGITIMGMQENQYHGTGIDGFLYKFSRIT